MPYRRCRLPETDTTPKAAYMRGEQRSSMSRGSGRALPSQVRRMRVTRLQMRRFSPRFDGRFSAFTHIAHALYASAQQPFRDEFFSSCRTPPAPSHAAYPSAPRVELGMPRAEGAFQRACSSMESAGVHMFSPRRSGARPEVIWQQGFLQVPPSSHAPASWQIEGWCA